MFPRFLKKFAHDNPTVSFDDLLGHIQQASNGGFWVSWQLLLCRTEIEEEVVFKEIETAILGGQLVARYICSKRPVQKLFRDEVNNIEFTVRK